MKGRTYIVGRDMITTAEPMARHFTSQDVTVRNQGCVGRDCFFPKPEPNK